MTVPSLFFVCRLSHWRQKRRCDERHSEEKPVSAQAPSHVFDCRTASGRALPRRAAAGFWERFEQDQPSEHREQAGRKKKRRTNRSSRQQRKPKSCFTATPCEVQPMAIADPTRIHSAFAHASVQFEAGMAEPRYAEKQRRNSDDGLRSASEMSTSLQEGKPRSCTRIDRPACRVRPLPARATSWLERHLSPCTAQSDPRRTS